MLNAGDGTRIDPDVVGTVQDVYLALNDAIDGQASGAVHAILSKADAEAKPVLVYRTNRYIGTQKRRVAV